MTCTDCPAFEICPEKPAREDYADENKYLIDLECGVWSCQKTIEKLCKENEQLKAQLEKMKCCRNCKYWNVPDDVFNSSCKECEICKNCNKWELAE